MGVLGKSRQVSIGVINNIGVLTNLLTSKAILVLLVQVANYEWLFVSEIVHKRQLVCFGFLLPLALVYLWVAFKMTFQLILIL